MKRDDYLSQPEVAGFVDWAGHLVRGEWGLEHSWKGKGPAFRCRTLYGAFERYLWPNSVNGDRFQDTVEQFDRFRQILNSTLPVTSRDDQDNFILNTRNVARWGGIRLTLDNWARMSPSELQAFLADIKASWIPPVPILTLCGASNI